YPRRPPHRIPPPPPAEVVAVQVGLTVTLRCNLACDYCYVPQRADRMTPETAAKAATLPMADGRFALWGGEPLVDAPHLRSIVSAVRGAYRGVGPLRFALTTNGTMVDEESAAWCAQEMATVGVSIDGGDAAHDRHRRTASGAPSAETAWRGLRMLLAADADVVVNQTLNPDTVDDLAAGVERLVEAGVRRISHGMNMRVQWPEPALELLRAQYMVLGERYATWLERDGVIIAPFDDAIRSHIEGGTERRGIGCAGNDSVLVLPDGRLAPCDAFIGAVDPDAWVIGDVDRGAVRVPAVLEQATRREGGGCGACALRARCMRSCHCRNLLGTGDPSRVPAAWCAYTAMTTEVADRVAGELYAAGSAPFMERFYGPSPSPYSSFESSPSI
ncbi:MAG TPA: radical SAM protein, partial [Coriobacteriia bacterium]